MCCRRSDGRDAARWNDVMTVAEIVTSLSSHPHLFRKQTFPSLSSRPAHLSTRTHRKNMTKYCRSPAPPPSLLFLFTRSVVADAAERRLGPRRRDVALDDVLDERGRRRRLEAPLRLVVAERPKSSNRWYAAAYPPSCVRASGRHFVAPMQSVKASTTAIIIRGF